MSDSGQDTAAHEVEVGTFARANAGYESLLSAADVSRVFGKPVVKGEVTVIPAAEVLAIGGFGLGSGSGADTNSSGQRRRGGGSGGGGGGRVLARSVAVVEVTADGVRVRPVVDVTKIALAALTAAGFVIAAWSGMARPTRILRGRVS
jgi:uncharacterized spore protein YtfJ